MRIFDTSKYNEEISKYKLLSSTAGVGAIINTKSGFNVIIHDIEQWASIKLTQERIEFLEGDCDSTYILKRSQYFIQKISIDPHWDQKIHFVNDLRFLHFLKKKYGYPGLELFVSIVDLTLDEHTNAVADPQWDSSAKPFNKENELLDLTIPASHFPKMFYNGNGELRHISFWANKALQAKDIDTKHISRFAPPFHYIKKDDRNIRIPLKQVNLVLICEDGHLSEIPWSKYITYRRQNIRNQIINIFDMSDCCDSPDLKWTESPTRSEGFASVFVECKNCERLNLGISKYNLEGITSLRVACKGHKPWNLIVDRASVNTFKKRNSIEKDFPRSVCEAPDGMQVALATANNTYFANNTSSLFIPYDLAQGSESIIQDMVGELKEKFTKKNKILQDEGDSIISPEQYAKDFINVDRISKMKWDTKIFEKKDDLEKYLPQINSGFLGNPLPTIGSINDLIEEYRYQEYKVFHDILEFRSTDEKDLEFSRVPMPSSFNGNFDVICKVNSLRVTSVQLNFSRVEPSPLPDPQLPGSSGQFIHNTEKEKVRCLPAVQALGEGIFFSLDQQKLNSWIQEKSHFIFSEERSDIFNKNDHYQHQRERVRPIKEKFFAVHTLCHLVMKELEFSCGYPVASLKERLYVSENMAAFLIFTSDGSEGSMGGLVSQLDGDKLENLVLQALKRAEICSSDPLCWEGNGSGLASLNLASCFSCSIVSETACEERNLCLDRRVLLDQEFGLLKDLI